MTIRNFFNQIFGVGLANTIIAIQGFLLVPIITKNLGIYDYGIWSQLMVIVTIVQPFVLLGLDSSMIRFLSGKKDKEKISDEFLSISIIVLILSFVVSLIFLIFSDFFSLLFFKTMSFTPLIIITGGILVIQSIFLLGLTFFRTFKCIKIYTIVSIFQTLSDLSWIWFCASLHYPIFLMLLGIFFIRIACTGFIFFIILMRINVKIPSFVCLKDYLVYGLPIMLILFFSYIISSGNRIIIGILLGPTEVGIYSIAFTLCNIIQFIAAPIAFILLPTIVKLWEETRFDTVQMYLGKFSNYFSIITIPLIFYMSTLGKPIIGLISTEGLPNANILILLIGFGFYLYYGIIYAFMCILALVKRTDKTAIIFIFFGLLNLILTYILVKMYGLFGAALTMFVIYVLMALSFYLVSDHYLKIEIGIPSIVKSVAASAIFSAIILTINPKTMLEIFLITILSVFIYFFFLFLFKVFTDEEVINLKLQYHDSALLRFFSEVYLRYSKMILNIQKLFIMNR